jgi:hypothetical protein
MLEKISSVVLLVVCGLGLALGCSGPDSKPYCADGTGRICGPSGLPFVQWVAVRDDACASSSSTDCVKPTSATEVALTQPESGKVCAKGTVAGRDGYVWLMLGVGGWNKGLTVATDTLRAKDLGIAALSFNVETPPSTGVTLFATAVHASECDAPPSCLGEGYQLLTGPRANTIKTFNVAGVQQAPLANFSRDNPNDVLDLNQLHDFIFVVNPGDFDFCISDLRFMAADGQEVTP